MIWIGTIGAVLILFAFAMNLTHKWTVQNKTYLIVNIIGNVGTTCYAISMNSIPFLCLQVAWGTVSIIKLINVIKKGKINEIN